MELVSYKFERYAQILQFEAMFWGSYLLVSLILCKLWDAISHRSQWWLGAHAEVRILLLRAPILLWLPPYLLLADVNELLARLLSWGPFLIGVFLLHPQRARIRLRAQQQ